MSRHVFRYKSIGGRLAPLITMGVRFGESWYPIEVYVDSGAAYTVLHAQIAEGVGFDSPWVPFAQPYRRIHTKRLIPSTSRPTKPAG
jgi:hypothetical protein